MTTKKIAQLGVLTTLALIFSYVESLIPVIVGIPGVKLGLANLVVVFMLYRLSFKEAFIVSIMRILLSGFLFGNLMSIIFSLAGAVFSICIMWLLKRVKDLSVIGISVAGGCMHNFGQLVVSVFVVQTSRLLYYFPILMVSGVITGLCIGILTKLLLRYLPDYFTE